MADQIFVNLPVKDLQRTMAFFGHLGYTFDERFTDENAACMEIGPNIYAMLLVEPFFATFTDREIIDTSRGIEAIFALALDSRAAVEAHIEKVVAAGGTLPRDPVDHGFMYQHGYHDPDGHLWEVFYMDMSQVPEA